MFQGYKTDMNIAPKSTHLLPPSGYSPSQIDFYRDLVGAKKAHRGGNPGAAFQNLLPPKSPRATMEYLYRGQKGHTFLELNRIAKNSEYMRMYKSNRKCMPLLPPS